MVFKGNPGEHIVLRPKQNDKIKRVRPVGAFDENGLLIVTEPVFIQRMFEKGFQTAKDNPEEKQKRSKKSE